MTESSRKRKQYLAIMEQYLDALLRKNTEIVPLAATYKATFNGIETTIGENRLWNKTLFIQQRQVFIDPFSGNAVLFGIATNEFQNFQGDLPNPLKGDHPERFTEYDPFYALTVIRLHIEDSRIDEIEELFEEKRYYMLRVPYSQIRLPELIFEVPVPEEERMTREELKETVEKYWDTISRKRDIEQLPVHPECVRLENGMICTNNRATFKGEFRIPEFSWGTPEELRFYPIIDEIRGTVVSFQRFITGSCEEKSGGKAINQYICEVFKVENGLLRFLMAFWRKDMSEIGWVSKK